VFTKGTRVRVVDAKKAHDYYAVSEDIKNGDKGTVVQVEDGDHCVAVDGHIGEWYFPPKTLARIHRAKVEV
jgi:hypothetical protein